VSELSVADLVLDPTRYADQRKARRAAAIELRRSRRVQVGDLVALEFENAETLTYQAQEMLYVEGISDETAAAAELAAYQRLLPGPKTLTATMLVEIADQAEVKSRLQALAGVHDAIRLEVGDAVSPARDVPPPDEGPSERTFSVHFLRFDLPDEAVAALQGSAPARIVVEHPAYAASTELSAQTRAQLVSDLTG
jgi:hypothetical protein